MASQGVAANSRLAQMQMRFQQKQLEEREQRRNEMTGATSAVSETSIGVKSVGNGRVRQMFDERRRGAGIDRSNPLKPIGSTSRLSASSTTLSSSTSRSGGPTTSTRRPPTQTTTTTARRPANAPRAMPRSETFEQNVANGNATRNQRHQNYDDLDDLDSETFPKGFSSLSLNDSRSSNIGDRNNNYNNKSPNNIKLNPVVTKKSPSVASPRPSARHVTPSTSASRARLVRATPDKPAAGGAVRTPPKSSWGKMPSSKMLVNPTSRVVTPPPGMATCRYCKRNFIEERLAKHEQVCQKMASTRRRIFDAAKHRVKGTDAEKYLKRTPLRTNPSAVIKPTGTYVTANTAPANMGTKKNNWRKKHEEFIQSIRAAKQVTAHLARGGKLSDLPPPPPSENADYVQCPHCLRRFNQSAAERHIPKCATMVHNKPKAGAAPGAKRR